MMNDRSREKIVGIIAVSALAVLVVIGMFQTHGARQASPPLTLSTEPEGIMGTSCRLAAVISRDGQERGRQALHDAEQALRRIEMLMSRWLEGSEISRFNAAGAGREFKLGTESLEILEAARTAYTVTDRSFDITVGPLVRLWRGAAEDGIVPEDDEIRAARAESSWKLIELLPGGAVKKSAGAEVDLGGIAKGYAIDRAVEAMRRSGAEGGLVDVGGDLRVFGNHPDGESWVIDVRDPYGAGILVKIGVRSGAVCTSGNYSRFFEIGDSRYSHIIDPRTGLPAASAASVTVVAGTAQQGDVWATALSVLGPDGIEHLPAGTEALLVVGEEEDYQLLTTPGFEDLVLENLKRR